MPNHSEMPKNFARCSAGEACPLSGRCLRSLVWRTPSDADLQTPAFVMVNLKCAALNALSEQCSSFSPIVKLRFAKGMQHLFDGVPHQNYAAVKNAVKACFSSERNYYYARSGAQLIAPEQQERIAKVFAALGIARPEFDAYEEVYDWER